MGRILVLGGDAGLAARIELAPGHFVVPVGEAIVAAPTFDIADLLIEGYLPDVVVLAEGVQHSTSLRLAATLEALQPLISVLIVAEAEPGLVLEAMRCGVRDVIAPDIGDEALAQALSRASDHSARRAVRRSAETAGADRVAESKVIVIVSPKGGVGKSTIAANLAVGLAQEAPMDVVLVDLDLQFGDIATHLDLSPSHSLSDAFASSGGIDSMLLKTFLTVHSSNFYVLCGSESPAAADRVNSKQVRELLGELAAAFRYVLVDTGAGLDEHTLAALEESNEVVVVSSMDVSSVRNVRKEIEVLAQLSILPATRHFVLNFADRQSGMTVRDVEAVVGIPVNVVVPRAAQVPLSANRGVPVLLNKKGGPAAKAIKQLVKRVDKSGRVPKSSFLHKGVEIS